MSWWQGALLVLLVSTLSTLAMAGPQGWNGQQLSIGLPLVWGQSLLFWWLFSLLLHFSADVFGGEGRIAQTLAACGVASTPFLLLGPLMVLAQRFGRAGQTLSLLLGMGLVFWAVALLSRLLVNSASLPLDRTLGVLVLSFFLMGALVAASFVLGGLQLAFWGASLL